MRDDELPEAYATATIYLGLSRIDNTINAEGFGISFTEASASGLPIIAGDSGGVRAAVRDGERMSRPGRANNALSRKSLGTT